MRSPVRFLLLTLTLLAPLLLLGWLVQAQPLPATPASSANLQLIGHSGGAVTAIARQGNDLVLASGPVLELLDVSDAGAPARLGMLPLAEPPQALALSGAILYVGDSTGLHWLNAAQPAAMTQVGTALTGQMVYDLARAGTALYVAHGSGLTPYNISNPAAPVAGTTLPAQSSWRLVYPAGSLGLAAEENGRLALLNLATPLAPSILGEYPLSGPPGGLVLVGNYVYASWTDCNGASCVVRITVLDVSNPGQPAFVTERFVGTGVAAGLTAAGGYLYSSRHGAGVVHNQAGLDVFDISVATAPSFVTDYDITGAYGAYDILLNGPTGYLAHGDAGLHILNLSDPTNPVLNTSWAGPTPATTVALADGLIYAGSSIPADRAVFWVWAGDEPAPLSQRRISELSEIRDLAVVGNRAYLLGPPPAGGGGRLQVLDVANPLAPTSLASFNTANAYHVSVSAGFAYIHNDNGLQIVDVRQPLTMTQVASYAVGGDTAIVAGRAYIAGGAAGLHILGVTSPPNATFLGALNPSWSADAVVVRNNYAYVAAGSAGLRIVDVSAPGAPQETGQWTPGWNINSVALAGNYLLAGTVNGGLRVLDVSQPGQPVEVAFYDDGWVPTAVAFSGDRVLGAAGESGLYQLAQQFQVAGHVRQPNGAAFAGATIALTGQPAMVTDGSGAYQFDGLAAGSYTIEPGQGSFVFTPTQRAVTVPPSQLAADFVVLPAPVTATVGAAGGSLFFNDTQGLATLVSVPAGALSETITLVLTPTLALNLGDENWLGHAFDLAVYRAGEQLPDYEFLLPLPVTINYSNVDLGLANEAGLALRQWQPPAWPDAGLSCTPPTTGSINQPSNQFTQGICTTGRFALFGPVQRLYLPLITNS
ncbi:MAG: carboxypeptidase regulatory-like domain-containing protein [Ardenticatenales bacterium]|nr:carboxypeptidase regulatory-like domain-containing protein [Ardenticatenales bacterium]